MRRFQKKIGLFFLVISVIALLVTSLVPYHWGNPWYSTKMRYLESIPNDKYNTYFFGSSTFYRHINPAIVDELVNQESSQKIASFNMGALATFCPQTYYLFEHFLESSLANNTKYCIMELRDIESIGDALMHQERTSYWMNSADLQLVANSFYHRSGMHPRKKFSAISKYSISYVENIFHIGHFGNILTKPDHYADKLLGPKKNGFFPLELDYATTDDFEFIEHLEERMLLIQEHPEVLERRRRKDSTAHADMAQQYDQVHLERINQLIQQAEVRGIELIFLISPRCASKEIVKLATQLDQNHLIDLSRPEEFPELYLLDNSFDRGHLNDKGATLYSEYLAEELIKKIN